MGIRLTWPIPRRSLLSRATEGKLRIASILLSIGIRSRTYFDYLARAAAKALAHDHDMPWPVLYDDHGEPQSLNPALNDWCAAHGVGFWDMHDVAVYEISSPWYFLAAAGDPRAYDLLVKGLHSRNLMIVATAAQGLGKLQDPRAVDELIATGRQVPGEARFGAGQALLFFSDPRAQAAAEEFIPNKTTLEHQRQDIKTRGKHALFPW